MFKSFNAKFPTVILLTSRLVTSKLVIYELVKVVFVALIFIASKVVVSIEDEEIFVLYKLDKLELLATKFPVVNEEICK